MPKHDDRPAAICRGGPHDGWAYWLDELTREIERGSQPYRAAGRFEALPALGDTAMAAVFDYAQRPIKRTRKPPPTTALPAPEAPADVCPDCGEATMTVRDPEGARVDLAPVLTPQGGIVVRGGIARRRPRADHVDPDSVGGYWTHRCVPHRLGDE